LFVLLLYCTGWTIYLQLDAADLLQASGWTTDNILQVLLHSGQIRAIVISILATFALYLLSSLWMLDPWHMVTSFLQYLFLTPTYVTILSIYSLANLHDVSWGTKGSDAASSDLGGASLNKDKEGAATIVEVKVPTSAKDAQELWQHAQSDLARKQVQVKQKRSAAIKQTDEQQNFRTKFLLFWLGTNAGLIIIFTSTWWANYTVNDLKLSANPYLLFLFYATAVLSAIRALGSLTYVIFRLCGH
jgi:chitin synthase